MGKISILTNIFQMGWNHQIVLTSYSTLSCWSCSSRPSPFLWVSRSLVQIDGFLWTFWLFRAVEFNLTNIVWQQKKAGLWKMDEFPIPPDSPQHCLKLKPLKHLKDPGPPTWIFHVTPKLDCHHVMKRQLENSRFPSKVTERIRHLLKDHDERGQPRDRLCIWTIAQWRYWFGTFRICCLARFRANFGLSPWEDFEMKTEGWHVFFWNTPANWTWNLKISPMGRESPFENHYFQAPC